MMTLAKNDQGPSTNDQLMSNEIKSQTGPLAAIVRNSKELPDQWAFGFFALVGHWSLELGHFSQPNRKLQGA